MKLTDLNIDCLEGILEHLQMRDFLNAADANKRLRHAATFIYVRKYSRTCLSFGFRYDYSIFERRSIHTFDRANFKIEIGNEDLSGSDMRPAFQLLRCFGRFVHRMFYFFHEDCNDDHKIYYDLFDYIEEYCSENLTFFRITFFVNQSKILLFKKPFVKLKELQLSLVESEFKRTNPDSCVTKDFAGSEPLKISKDCLVKSFPNIQKLGIETYGCSQFVHSDCIANHFPYLEELALTDDRIEKCESCTEIYANLLRLNPQIKSLESWQNLMDMNIFQSLSESLQNLEHFKFDYFDDFTKNFNGKKLHLKNLKTIWLHGLWPDTCINPFSFDQLESLFITTLSEPIEYFNPYFEENPSIGTLGLRIFNAEDVFELMQNQAIITKGFPFLKEFKLEFDSQLSVTDVVYVMDTFNKLTYFEFKVYDESAYKDLQKHLNLTEWYSSYTETHGSVMLKRRNKLT